MTDLDELERLAREAAPTFEQDTNPRRFDAFRRRAYWEAANPAAVLEMIERIKNLRSTNSTLRAALAVTMGHLASIANLDMSVMGNGALAKDSARYALAKIAGAALEAEE